jgi:adenosylcobinamide kinase/adenosylcobinamide-phosphate guanylyltransferase
MADPLVLVLGGTRSGKSRHGLELTKAFAGAGRAWFLATARRGDPELERRIERHQRDRSPSWPTVDVGIDLASAIAGTIRSEPVLVEGLTLWLSALVGEEILDPDPILDGPVAAALDAIRAHPAPIVVVSDEIGMGVVPMHAGARAFRDLAGLVHQRFALEADEVRLVVAGLPMTLKSRGAG